MLLSSYWTSEYYAPLTGLHGLRQLYLLDNYRLPNCLGQLTQLEALVSADGLGVAGLGGHRSIVATVAVGRLGRSASTIC